MKLFSTIFNVPIALINKYDDKLVSFFYLYFIVSFFIDRLLFSFLINFPFFVVSAIFIFPFLFLAAQNKNSNKKQLFVLVFTFMVITIVVSIMYVFGVQNISDLLFIILFITIYFYYNENIAQLKISNAYVLLILTIFLFSFTFFNIDADSSKTSTAKYYSYFNKAIPFVKKTLPANSTSQKVDNNKEDVVSDYKSVPVKDTKIKKTTPKKKPVYVDKYKSFNIRHTGLFRRTHMASYFFGYLFLFFAFQYQKNRGIFNAIILIVTLGFCLYTGIRSMPAAFILSGVIFLFRRKYIVYLVMLLALIVLFMIANEYFLQLTKNTIFYQYVYLTHMFKENISGLARFQLYQSWWNDVSDFGFLNLLMGKSYMGALMANGQNYGKVMWFHNDFLNIFYSYGILGLMMYIWFFIKIYRDNKVLIKQNLFIFVFYTSMIITAVINGYYYYFPVFLMYLFLLMIKDEKQTVR